jgi:hypothetical protein
MVFEDRDGKDAALAGCGVPGAITVRADAGGAAGRRCRVVKPWLPEHLLTTFADTAGVGDCRPGVAQLFRDDFSVRALLAAVSTDSVHPEVMLLAAGAAVASLPVMLLAEVPPATTASAVAVGYFDIVLDASDQAAASTAAAVPVMQLVARLAAPATPAPIPVVVNQTGELHGVLSLFTGIDTQLASVLARCFAGVHLDGAMPNTSSTSACNGW